MNAACNSRLDVALATYNGRRWLVAFLDSLALQSRRADRLVVVDDASTDGSAELIQRWCERQGIECLFHRNTVRLGPAQTYSQALALCDADYVALADQDDLWRADKLEVLLAAESGLRANGRADEHPTLIFSDYALIDEQDHLLARSGLRAQGFSPRSDTAFRRLLVQNLVAGCTILLNRALLRLALPVPTEAVMHDWWIALVAAGLGRIGYVDAPLVGYRQHGANTLGARASRLDRWRRRLSRAGLKALKEEHRHIWEQAQSFQDRYAGGLVTGDAEWLGALLALQSKGRFSRRRGAVALGVRKSGVMRTLGLYWAL